MDSKLCAGCSTLKPHSEFALTAAGKSTRKCTACRSAARRGETVKRLYRVPVEQYDEMLAQQNGVCWVCLEPPDASQRLHLDHDHVTGHIRGLLCRMCNVGIGYFRDRPDLLLRAAQYLR